MPATSRSEIQLRIKRRDRLARCASFARCARPVRRAAHDDNFGPQPCAGIVRRTRSETPGKGAQAADRESRSTVCQMNSQSAACFARSSGRTLQKLVSFLFGQWTHRPFARLESELRMLMKFARELDEISRLQALHAL